MEDKIFQSYINSKSISELADDLSKTLKQYKTETLDPDTTQSIPNLGLICGYYKMLLQQENYMQ